MRGESRRSTGKKKSPASLASLALLFAGTAVLLLSSDPETALVDVDSSPPAGTSRALFGPVVTSIAGDEGAIPRTLAEAAVASTGDEEAFDFKAIQALAPRVANGRRRFGAGKALRKLGKDNNTAVERPVMHTFYSEARDGGGSKTGKASLLAAWTGAWRAAGWEPRVLTMEDAQRHPDYETYRAFLDSNPWGPYNTMCFWRWFAMATVESGGWMSDYDVFPLNPFLDQVGEDLPNGGNLTTHEWFVPGLVSGTQAEYDRVANLIVKNAEHKQKDPDVKLWSDMFALKDLWRNGRIHGQSNSSIIGSFDLMTGLDLFEAAPFDEKTCDKLGDKIAVHFAHYYISQGLEKKLLPENRTMNQRAEISEEWIRKWQEMCSTSREEGTTSMA